MGIYYGLTAKTKEEFNTNLENLVNVIQKRKHTLSEITDFEGFFNFLRTFITDADYRNPFWIDNETTVTSAEIDILRKHNYPEEYIEWCEKYGQYSIGLDITLSSVSDVLKNIANEYYGLQVKNNYLYFATDGSGNDFAFDVNEGISPIRIFDHNGYITPDWISNIYSDVFNFYFDDETNEYVNPENLDISIIFDENGEYRADAIYIKNYCFDIEKLALSYQEKGELEEAFLLYDAILESHTQKALAYNNRAYELRTAGILDKSLEYIDKALVLEPENGLYNGTKAEILFDMGYEDLFFQSLELALKFGMEANLIDDAMKVKYKNDSRFTTILSQYE
ncbi:hypothetical protein OF897_16970 [Chryseobacterium formosus]|uniref:Knr4/Smi1-like domain-containing protein n=1 Tax=Chryseobacterium formosus TaxID=1537363 RepID=A0ABT3XVG4_9FLAO|nr:hypothetical protein [Chryseobacterium formosus]MCX8525608.1 hypothetical protein [Chryseobacterium formosus]